MHNPTEPGRRSVGIRGRLLAAVLPLVALAFIGVWLIATMTARRGLVALSDLNLALSAQNLAGAVSATFQDAYADAVTSARLDLPAQAIARSSRRR